jgi:gluconolactonase
MRLGSTALLLLAASLALGLVCGRGSAQGAKEPPSGTPDATIDLTKREGVEMVKGQWRYSDVKIIEVDYRGKKTYDYTPHADTVARPDFDDSAWEALDPPAVRAPRAGGKICFNWYRITITVPERVGSFDTTGATVVFDTIVDDYGEVWVDGKLNYGAGQKGGAIVAGFNAPNRLVVGRDVKPGDKITLAIFGINGPISASPANSIFLRHARLDFYKKQALGVRP